MSMELDPRADRLRERSIDRHSSVRASVVISFGLTGRARSQSSCHGMDRVFAAEFEVAGSRFVGRSFNVGGISPRHASISVHSRDRDVSCVDFVSIIHPDYRPEPIRAAVVHGARLLSSRAIFASAKKGRRGGFGQRSPPVTRLFLGQTDLIGYFRERDFARSETHSRLYRLSITIRLLTDGNDYFLFVFEVIFKSVAHKRRDKNKRKFFLEKLIY